MTGSIIHFPVQLTEDDPKGQSNLELIPAGYLRCDGRVLFAVEYPELAAVLGTGLSTRFLKDGQALTDEQFQLPDLRSKNIKATSSSNIGQYNDLVVQDDNNEDVFKAGIGLDVVQNIESPYELTYTGEFYIPPQTIDLRGEPRFTLDTGVYTSTDEVPQNAWQPHMHRSQTLRARQKDKAGNFFSARQKNHVRTKSSLNVCQWWENTAQPLCYYQWSGLSTDGGTGYPQLTDDTNNTKKQFYGACITGCLGFTSSNYCLWPQDGDYCPEVNNENFDFRKSESGCATGDWSGNSVTMGNITYEPEAVAVCVCQQLFGVFCVGGEMTPATSPSNENSDQLTNYGPDYGVDDKNMPFTTLDATNYQTQASGVANVTTTSGDTGNDGIHRHRIDFDAEEAHTFQMKTRAAFARADSGLLSQITIKKNEEPKADKYIQPYIITEYLIKI